MKKFLIANFLFFFLVNICAANDTTSVRIFFGVNEHKLATTEKEILDGILPSDTSIVLKSIRIYGYSDSAEKNDAKNRLSFNRAKEVKKYLIEKGLDKSLIITVEGKGLKTAETGQSGQENRIVVVLIEYEAKVVEETIIIKSSPKKTFE